MRGCVGLVFLIFSALVMSSEEYNKQDVAAFIKAFQYVVMQYDIEAVSKMVSRERLEQQISNLSIKDEELRNDFLRYIFNAEFSRAHYCLINLDRVSFDGDQIVQKIYTFPKNSETGEEHDVYLGIENGYIKRKYSKAIKNVKRNDDDFEIDLCDIPINEENPNVFIAK